MSRLRCRERALQPTAPVHEAGLELADHVQDFEVRSRCFSVAARTMRPTVQMEWRSASAHLRHVREDSATR